MSPLTLPLTAFEEFLLWEDRPAYPWSIFARLHFSGRIDCSALESAIQVIMPRHPLLMSRLEMRRGRPFWVVQPGVLPQITRLSGPTGQAMPSAGYLDLRNEIGLRLFVVENGESSDLTVQCHHACCDGMGIQTFAIDLLIAYALEKGMQSTRLRLPELDPRRLPRRGTYGLTFSKLVRMLPQQVLGLPGAWHFFLRSPSPLLPHRVRPDEDQPPTGFPVTRTHTFMREETAVLSKTARRLKVTVNDLLVRDLYLTLAEWRARHGASDNDWLRVMVPMNLRSPSDRLLPAANVIGSIFLDRRGSDFADHDKLLAGIADELRIIKQNRLGLIFIHALRAFRLLPGGLKHNARRDKCTVSSIFSNMGKPWRQCPLPRDRGRHVAGDVILEQIDGAAPIRPYNCATFLALDYAHRLTVTLHYDPRVVSAAQADDLAATFARRVLATVSSNQ